MEKERWHPIEGFEGMYDISDFGRIKRYHHIQRYTAKGKPVYAKYKVSSYSSSKNRYLHTRITKRMLRYRINIHIWVAKYFVPNPNNLPEVNHLDGDKTNPFYKNLEWTDRQGNMDHAWETGLRKNCIGENHAVSKLTNENVLFIFNSDLTQKELAKLYSVSQHSICCIKKGKTWKHITGKQNERKKLTNQEAIEIFNSNSPYKELAHRFKTSESNISVIKLGKTFKNSLKHLNKNKPTELIGNNYYLGEEKIIEIFKATGGCNEIARRFNTSASTVSNIRNRKRWANITNNL